MLPPVRTAQPALGLPRAAECIPSLPIWLAYVDPTALGVSSGSPLIDVVHSTQPLTQPLTFAPSSRVGIDCPCTRGSSHDTYAYVATHPQATEFNSPSQAPGRKHVHCTRSRRRHQHRRMKPSALESSVRPRGVPLERYNNDARAFQRAQRAGLQTVRR